jgi:hypothetical protein
MIIVLPWKSGPSGSRKSAWLCASALVVAFRGLFSRY